MLMQGRTEAQKVRATATEAEREREIKEKRLKMTKIDSGNF